MKKLNLIEILKDCPKGTKLYSPVCGEVTFGEIDYDTDTAYPIVVYDANGFSQQFTEEGVYFTIGTECLLFPSRECRDWSTFTVPVAPHKYFEPFEKVLIENYASHTWSADFYSNYDEEERVHRLTSGGSRKDHQIIPYFSNENKLGSSIKYEQSNQYRGNT